MTSQNHQIKHSNSLLKSFQYAFRGIAEVLKTERNFRIHLVFATLALVCCWLFGVQSHEWVTILILIALVLSLESINTCIEGVCDLISIEYNNQIKRIKDIAAGAVLVAAILSVVIGCIIFIPYLISFVT